MKNTTKAALGKILSFCENARIKRLKTVSRRPPSRAKTASGGRHFSRSNRIFRVGNLAIALLLAAFLIPMTGLAQERQPDRGVQFANSYVAGSLEAVNVSNGNVVINLPLASLPKGRGTSPGFTVTLQYNSKLWDSKQTTVVNQLQSGSGEQWDQSQYYAYSSNKLEASDRGGWKLLSSYRVKWTNRLNLEAPDPCIKGDPIEKIRARWKLEVEFPDGSVRSFIPTTGTVNTMDGYYDVDFNGKRYHAAMQTNGAGLCYVAESTSQTTTAGMNYITTDGSRLRMFIPYLAGQSPSEATLTGVNWKIYAADGTVVENKPPDDSTVSQRISDRNGNKVEVKGNQIVDQLGRSITLTGSGVTTKGVSGEDITTLINWGTRYVHRRYKAISNDETVPDGTDRYDEIFAGIQTVEQITLPSQAGGQSYSFEYYADAAQQYGTNYTNGWGELKSVTMPTGAKATYIYQTAEGTEVTAPTVLENRVTTKDLVHTEEYDGVQTQRTEKTLYDGSDAHAFVTLPNGASSGDHLNAQTFSQWDSGLAYKSIHPDGSFTERIWKNNLPTYTGNLGLYNYASGNANAYVRTEFTTINDAAGNPTLTAIKDYNYDKNGNVTKTTEYDWVAYGAVPRTNTRPSGIPTGATVKRITYNEYYNQAPDADSTTASANTYENPNSPKLKNVLKSTTITDGNNAVVSRSEFTYDDANNKGNLTEIKTWDSSKGAYSNPLSAGNSISVSSQYDSYGNLTQTTDAKGIVSTFTYGNITTPSGTVSGLYPTQTVAAYGTAQQRTSTAEYDFYTGLVKKATDVDNNLSSETVYDALGRPAISKAAVNTANEVWTQTEYNDVQRRVISRSDLFVKGDGKKVSIQHFDQLGRVRLTRTLEDAATESATNETHGIKVQTRYRYDNAANPASSNGSFTLVSNPYRTGNEAEMGWTVSYTNNTGKFSTTKTYAGGSLPVPFGSNSNLTGTVSSETDEIYGTTTDQAGKKRRRVTNALGQLVRVDEPDDNGNLGSVSSPAQPTVYSYDTLGNMVKVTQGAQNRFFKYDSLGRLIRVRQPEQGTNSALALADSVTGNGDWSAGFTYDANGNMLTSMDTKGVLVTNTYDNLNRPLTRSYSDSTPAVTYTYDDPNIQYSKGKLTKTSNAVSTSQVTAFDNLGRVISGQQITDGNTYNFGYQYNLSGMLTEETYPSGRKVKNTFETDGDLAQIETQKIGGNWEARAQNFVYSPAGAIARLQIGNGLWETAQFNSRLQVTQLGLGTSATDTSLWKLDYDFGGATNNDGNIKAQTVTSPVGVFAQNFTYDSLNRLKTAQETVGGQTVWTQAFTYDRYGNRTGFNQTIGGQTTNQTPQIDTNTNRFTTGQGFTYDLAGNIIQDAQGRQFTFNGDNKQTEVRDQNNNVIGQYFYDGDGKRIKKVTPSETVVFVYSGGKIVAEYSSNPVLVNPSTQYLGTDMLGSPRVITNQNGNVVSRRDFMPFGEDLQRANYGADKIRQKFSGYQKDSETGLDFAEARYYNNAHGRFTAVDPLLASGKSSDPQTFNRYAYCLNNPINCIDPTGLDGVWGYRSVDGGTQLQYFNSQEELNTFNSNNRTQGCLDGTLTCVDYQVWKGGDYIVWSDRTGSHLGTDGTRTDFSLADLNEEDWNDLANATNVGNGYNDRQTAILNAFRSTSESRAMANELGTYILDARLRMWSVGRKAIGEPSNRESGDDFTRIRHYTNRKGLEGIKEEGKIKISDQGCVFCELANKKPLSPRDAENKYGIRPGRGRDFVETDVPSSILNKTWNTEMRTFEFRIKQDVILRNPEFFRRR